MSSALVDQDVALSSQGVEVGIVNHDFLVSRLVIVFFVKTVDAV